MSPTYLPNWLTSEDLFVDEDYFRLAYALGLNPGESEAIQRGLVEILKSEPLGSGTWASPEADCMACIKILAFNGLTATGKVSKAKSVEMWYSFKEQLLDWCEHKEYDSPFSMKQWNKVIRGRFNGYGPMKGAAQNVVKQLRIDVEAGGEIWPENSIDLVPGTERGKVVYKPKAEQAKPERKPVTPQVEPLAGMTPLGMSPKPERTVLQKPADAGISLSELKLALAEA